jgi:hypothetical protein
MTGTIITLGWSEGRCLFSILTCDKDDYSLLEKIRADSIEEALFNEYLQDRIALTNIPRTTFISEAVTSAQPTVAVLSVDVQKSSDSSQYDLLISGNFYEERNLPKVKKLYWDIDDDDRSNVAEYGRAPA